jgi:hypothetical protein
VTHQTGSRHPAHPGPARLQRDLADLLLADYRRAMALNVSAFHGRIPNSFHALVMVTWLTFSRAASSRLDQCVTPRLAGGGTNVSATICRWSMVRGTRHPDPFGDVGVQHPFGGQQHDPCSLSEAGRG